MSAVQKTDVSVALTQDFTDAQKSVARTNISAASESDISTINNSITSINNNIDSLGQTIGSLANTVGGHTTQISTINNILTATEDDAGKALVVDSDGNPAWTTILPSYDSSTSQKILTVNSAGNLVWQLRTGYVNLGSHYVTGGGAATLCWPISDFGDDLIFAAAPLSYCIVDGTSARQHIINDTYDYVEVNFRMQLRWADGNNITEDYLGSRSTQYTPPTNNYPVEFAILDTAASSIVGDSTIYAILQGNSNQYQIVQGIIKCTNTSAFALGIHLFDSTGTDWSNAALVPQGLWYSVKEFGRRT